jgi:CelD/BcsL family acetyltransferase involved in cellulose biosynthesis
MTLLFEVARSSLAHGLDCDFMTGEQPYKVRLATSRCPLFSVAASAQTLRSIAGPPVFIPAAA